MVPLVLMLAMVIGWSPASTIKKYIIEHYPWNKVEVESVKFEGKLPPEKPTEIIVQRGPIGRAVFLMGFPDGKYIKVYATVDAQQTVVKTVRPLKRGTILKREDLYLAPVNVRRLPKNAITDIEDAVGKILRRSVRSDMVITESMIADKPLIHRGQKVTILYEKPGLRLTAPGIAKEDGYKGKSIEVMNLWSRKIIVGQVVNSSTVNITP